MLPQLAREPYTQTLNLLRRIDVLRLCVEFKIPSDGTVIALKDKIRRHLNENRDTLFNDPQFNPLYPKVRHVIQPPAAQPPAVSHQVVRPLSPTLSESSLSSISSDHSYESWHGIEVPPVYHDPPAQPPYQAEALPPHEVVPQDFPAHHYHLPPPPSPSVPGSEPDPFLFNDHNAGPRKFFPFPFIPTRLWFIRITRRVSPIPIPIWIAFFISIPSCYHGPFVFTTFPFRRSFIPPWVNITAVMPSSVPSLPL